jgi:succinate-acetate transporter protein
MGENEMKMPVANPAALGLFGLALATLVASSLKLGLTEEVSRGVGLIPWLFFLGGFAQMIASVTEFKRGNSFTATAFAGYGLFWFGMGMTLYLQPTPTDEVLKQLGFVYIGYLIFSIYMMYAAASINKAIFLVFFAIVLLFAALILTTFFDVTPKFAGLAELFVSITGFYASAAIILKDVAGFDVVPTGQPMSKIKKIQL